MSQLSHFLHRTCVTFHVLGTLNPALQDRFGRPKRDISTIIHILNDLLCATPQYRRHARQGHTITLEASGGGPPKSSSSGGSSLVSAESRTGHTLDFMGKDASFFQIHDEIT
jgi:hypothetical protein